MITPAQIAKRTKARLDKQAYNDLFTPYIDKPVQFIEELFYLYDTEDLMQLYDCQKYPLIEATRKDANGNYVYNTVLWSWCKKSAKSSVIAAIADYVACTKPKARIRLIANDLKQADSRVGYYMRENIKIGQRKGYGTTPHASRIQEFRRDTKMSRSGYTIEYPNGSIVECVPIDPTGEAGGNDDLIIFSELWGWTNKSHQNMFAEATISPNRFGQAQRWIDTYAGFEGESVVLENLYLQIVKDENRLDIKANPECYASDSMFATWVTQHHFRWQTKEYYAEERKALTVDQFRRLHLNEWVTSANAFVPIDWYDNCIDNDIPNISRLEEIIIALDAGITSDCFAMVAVSRDRRFTSRYTKEGVEAPDYMIRRYARAWTPPKNGKLAFWSPDPNEITPASELKRLVSEYNVVQITYDPYQLEHFVSQMEYETDAWFDAFNQHGEREIGDKMLYDMIREKRLAHDGRDNDLREHVKNAAAKSLNDDRKLRIVKKADDKKIDLVVTLAMAVKRCCELVPK